MTNRTAKTATATQIYFAARARMNAGASVEDAIKGAIRECGPLRAARVSSAQAKGAAKRYAYWGATRYVIGLAAPRGKSACGLVKVARERASSDRRSQRLAERDLEALCEREDRVDADLVAASCDPQSIAFVLGLV